MKPEMQGAAQRMLPHPMIDREIFVLVGEGMRIGDLGAGAGGSPSVKLTSLHWPSLKPKQGLLGRRTGLFSTHLLCIRSLGMALLVGIWASLSSLHNEGKGGPSQSPKPT